MKARRRKAKDAPFAALGSQLENLRLQRGISQIQLAAAMGMGQSALSHLERRADILVSTLTEYVESLGGWLCIEAKFRSGENVKLLESGNQPVAVGASSLVEADKQLTIPMILGPEQQRPSRDVLFSIRPNHAEKIFKGDKTVELRRRFASAISPGTLALIYSTSPTSALTGSAKIKAVHCMDLPTLWKTHREGACLRKRDFEDYFSGLERGYAIILDAARPLDRPVSLMELRKRFGFEPPQSYQYASPYIRGLVEHERPQAPH
jgi:predicted transcriptional regulator/transcriptional regulator with XRE-family HTH domain